MKNPRIYGSPPYTVAVIHDGPGAGGEMAPVARRLASAYGVLEPIQTATTVDGQVEELKSILEEQDHRPISLIGYSWGAWLALLVSARFPLSVERLVLVSSGPFEEGYTEALRATRLQRLCQEERIEFESLLADLHDAAGNEKDRYLARLGELVSRTDEYAPIPGDCRASDAVALSGETFQGVWSEAAQMRRSGELLAIAGRVICPVVAIHGDYDPHPAEGVAIPLAAVLEDFCFVLLERCGHTPWIERHASEEIYRVIEESLSN